jgi:uncharacterized protein
VLFVSFYVATYLALSWARLPLGQWLGLVSAGVATAITVAIWERGTWPLGLFVAPRLAIREFVLGALAGVAIVGVCVVLVDVTSELRHELGRGFPWLELVAVFVPAAIHEELLFRGYAFQKMHRRHRVYAIFFVALAFAALHAQNDHVTLLGLTNILLGGVLLGLAYERYGRLWFPIGLHLAWNLMAGPVTGHEVSGYVAEHSLLVTRGEGPVWITGGDFGVEGSVWMTACEVAAIAILLRMNMIAPPRVSIASTTKESIT